MVTIPMRNTFVLSMALGISMGLAGCASSRPGFSTRPLEELLQRACAPGQDLREVRGSVWMKVASRESSGQFPAQVRAVEGKRVDLEVTNLLGGVEARIHVDEAGYQLDLPGKKGRQASQERGEGHWGGIPLTWAPDLFLGRVPCPPRARWSELKYERTALGGVKVTLPARLGGGQESFEYSFRRFEGEPWPETLVWTQSGAFARQVTFQMDDPEKGSSSPRKIVAKSDLGEVKIRWTRRDLTR